MTAGAGIEVVYAEAGRAWRTWLDLPPGSTVGTCLDRLAALQPGWPEAALRPAACAVFGRLVDVASPLSPGDRLELLRGLPTDPKLARRARASATKTPR